jgi:hypothetical protein
MRRIAVLSAAVLVGGLLGPSSALATGDEATDRWIAVEDHFAVVLPDGQTFTEDAPPPGAEEEEFAPPVGARLFISEALYATADGTTRGDEVGRTHIECTAGVVPATFLCDIAFVFGNGSQLHGVVHVDFSTQSETEPLRFDIAVTGGTDDFFGATGEVALLDITPAGDPAAETLTLYEANVD